MAKAADIPDFPKKPEVKFEFDDTLKTDFSKLKNIIDSSNLSNKELSNFNRFKQKLPSASHIEIEKFQDGAKVFRAEVLGDVPGSKAVYEKFVNLEGNTVKYYKTTYAPDGSIIHIKDKINNIMVEHK
jgi:hypothetical protein